MTARDESVERARRLRTLIEECERIAGDVDDPRQEQAFRWLNRLLANDLLTGYPSQSPSAPGVRAGMQGHTRGPGASWHDDLVLDGWSDGP